MPKVLIREHDKSTTGILTENNFAVVVPGYFGTHSGNEKEILIDHDVYELKSQADFIKYIGKHSSQKVESIAPTLEKINDNVALERRNIDKYFRAITPSDFESYADTENPVYIYEAVRVQSNEDEYGKNGHLLVTLNHTDEEAGTTITETYKLSKVEISDIQWTTITEEGKDPEIVSLNTKFCKIIKGYEGNLLPKNNLTRAEFATIVYNFYSY